MEHSSVNGLVNEKTVEQMYDMIVENARRFLDVPPEDLPSSKKFEPKNRGKPQEQGAGRSNQDDTRFQCGSKDHWIRDCPHRQQQQQQSPKPAGTKIRTPQPGTAIRPSLKPKTSSRGTKGQSKGKGKDATKKPGQKTKVKFKNKPSAKGAEVEGEPEEPEEGDEDTQESDEEHQEPPEEGAEEGVEQDSSEPESPESEPAEAKMIHIVMDQMKNMQTPRSKGRKRHRI